MCLDVEVNPKMPRTKSKAVSEGNGPFLRNKAGFGELTGKETYRALKEGFDRADKHLEKFTGRIQMTIQRLTGLQHQAQQPRLAIETDVKPDMKSRERMKGAVADDEKYGDILSAWVDDDLLRLTSFVDKSTEPPAPII